MGWMAYHKDGTVTEEGKDGRPGQAGNEGQLRLIVQEDYGHRVVIDLINGVIIIDCDAITVQNNTVEIANPKAVLYVCDETNLLADIYDIQQTEPDSEGWYENKIIPLEWRPIWFTRHTSGVGPTKVIGLQTTLPESFGGHNIKKMVSIFDNGRIGIS